MAHKNFNITATAITWDVEETEITQDEIAFVNIACAGVVDSNGCTIDQAIDLVPGIIPISSTGPVRLATGYTGADLQKKSARFVDGNIRIEATYRKPVGVQYSGPGGGTEEITSDNDRGSYRIANTEEPLLSSPVALAFPEDQIRLLKNLIEGDIKPNDETDETKAWFAYEFVKLNTETNEWSIEITFDPATAEVGGVTASPYDYARLITAGITTYKRPTVIYTISGSRENGINAGEVALVGTVQEPNGAFSVAGRDWLYEGINQDQVTEKNFTISREYSLSGDGGYLKELYKGATGTIISE